MHVSKWKIKRTKSSRWIQRSRMWTKGMNVWLIPKKALELNAYGSPGVPGVFITSHFPVRWNMHAHRRYMHVFISLIAVRRVSDSSPFPKCDPVRFTSSIKTFRWSQDGVPSPYKKASPMGTPQPKIKKIYLKVKTAFGWCAGYSGDEKYKLFQIPSTCFFPPLHLSLDIILFPQWAQMQSLTHSCDPDTQRSNTHLLYGATGRLTHTSSLSGNCAHTRPDWQIDVRNEYTRTRPEASLITITPLSLSTCKEIHCLRNNLSNWAASLPSPSLKEEWDLCPNQL